MVAVAVVSSSAQHEGKGWCVSLGFGIYKTQQDKIAWRQVASLIVKTMFDFQKC